MDGWAPLFPIILRLLETSVDASLAQDNCGVASSWRFLVVCKTSWAVVSSRILSDCDTLYTTKIKDFHVIEMIE